MSLFMADMLVSFAATLFLRVETSAVRVVFALSRAEMLVLIFAISLLSLFKACSVNSSLARISSTEVDRFARH